MAFSDIQAALDIPTLCRMLATSERNLRMAFQRVHGISPYRYLRMLMFSRARRALMSARGRSMTVTKIATRFGFADLGRFSVEYRKMFGESPSETLRQAVRGRERRKKILNDRAQKICGSAAAKGVGAEFA
jgi:transcriptional regulator GlxA family with amidase domain